MNRRRLVIGIIGVIVFAAVVIVIGVVLQSPPADAISVRFHSFNTNGPQRFVACVVSNTTTKDFLLTISTEYMTNGTFPTVPVFSLARSYETWGAREHGLSHAEIARGSNRCRVVVQYHRVPTTRPAVMFERLRTALLGSRRVEHSYSDEFRTPP